MYSMQRIKWQSECADADWKIRDARRTFFYRCEIPSAYTVHAGEIADEKTLVKSNTYPNLSKMIREHGVTFHVAAHTSVNFFFFLP